ncbi:DUF2169 domain-containing protein [Cystobacter fuscus]|uniref:DUF2169 family type VI secretion system accessory protein n=1 Tax=Cystobacter fuscus TaxID=43 RepID=UPI002B2C78A6|nr:DUF2169 domain-containing protein [Cystobacter fuscus]
MSHPAIDNRTPFAFEPMLLMDEDGSPLLVPLVKATYTIGHNALALADEGLPVCMEGESWGKPGRSSYRYEPECAFFKPAMDVVLVGHAHAPERGTRELLVTLRVGPVQKSVRVVGDRIWFKTLGSVSMTKPLPFERVPLVYERAFGGWDRSHPDASKHALEPRNPVGVGFRASPRNFEEGLRLPNLEDPEQPVKQFGQAVAPTGFGFTSPDWQPRASYGGTYDAAWEKNRAPLLPKDFDRRFFNAASSGLVAPGYLRGDEAVTVVNASPGGYLAFKLPGQPPPTVTVEFAHGPDIRPVLRLDTLIIDTDEMRVLLLWRGSVPLLRGPHDVRSLEIRTEAV